MNKLPMKKSELSLKADFKRGPGCGNVRGSPQFISPREIVYVVGEHLIVEDVTTKKQTRFITLPYPQASLLALSLEEGQFVAVAFSNDTPCICLFNLKHTAEDFEMIQVSVDIECMCFSCDGVDLAFVTPEGDKEYKITVWDIEQKNIVKTELIIASEADPVSSVFVISANPFDPHSYAVAGKGLLRKINYSERNHSWEEICLSFPLHVSVISLAWIDYWTMLIGCNDGTLRVADHEKVKASYRTLELETLDTTANEHLVQHENATNPLLGRQYQFKHNMHKERYNCKVAISEHSVMSIATYPQGFAYSCVPDFIILMQETSKNKYSKVRTLKLDPDNMYDLRDVVHLAVCTLPKTLPILICTTQQGQNYFADISIDPKEITLEMLGPNVHSGPITGLEIGWFKEQLVSVSRDRQLIIWNVTTGEVEFTKTYNMDITGVTMDQTGFYLYVSLENSVKFYMYRHKNLTEKSSFDILSSSTVQISNRGSFVALVNGFDVMVVDNTYFELNHMLIGNEGTIKRLAWSYTDSYLASCAANGSIWLWHLPSEERWKCLDLENVSFNDIAMLKTKDVMCAVGNSPYIFTLDLQTLRINRILAWSSLIYMTCISISTSDKFLFVGGDEGSLVSMWNPFEKEEERSRWMYPAHTIDISHIRISPGHDFLITGSHRGTIARWSISFEGLTIPEIIKMKIPVYLIVKEDYFYFLKKQAMLKRRLNTLPGRFHYKLKSEEQRLSEELYQQKNKYNHEIREKQNHIAKLVQISNTLKNEYELISCQKAKMKKFMGTSYLKLNAEEFLLQIKRDRQLIEIDEYCERSNEELAECYEKEKQILLKKYEDQTDKITRYISEMKDTLQIVQVHSSITLKEIKKANENIDRVHGVFKKTHNTLQYRNEELKVAIDTEPYVAKQKLEEVWDDVYRLTNILQRLHAQVQLEDQRQKELIPQYEYAREQWALISRMVGAQEYMMEEPPRNYNKILEIRRWKNAQLEGALPLRDRMIWEKTKEAETLEFKTVPQITRKAEVQIPNYHWFMQHHQKELSNTKELSSLEKKVEITMQDLHDSLFSTDQQCRLIVSKYKNARSFTNSISETIRDMTAEFTRRRTVTEKPLMLRPQTDDEMRLKKTSRKRMENTKKEIFKSDNQKPLVEKTLLEMDMDLRPPNKYEPCDVWVSKMIEQSERRRQNKIYKLKKEKLNWYKTLVKEKANMVKEKPSRKKHLYFKDPEEIKSEHTLDSLDMLKEDLNVRYEHKGVGKQTTADITCNNDHNGIVGLLNPYHRNIKMEYTLDTEEIIRKQYAPHIQRLNNEMEDLEERIEHFRNLFENDMKV